jgi:DNA-binding IclR family transcriptional regulator
MDAHDLPAANSSRPGIITAAHNALRLLAMFEAHPRIRVGAAMKELGLSRSTVNRLLGTLALERFVEHDRSDQSYLPGPALVAVSASIAQTQEPRVSLRDALSDLATSTRETVHLAVLRDTEVFYLDSIESEQAVRTGSRVGWSFPAHLAAAGKALLAVRSDQELRRMYPAELITVAGHDPKRRADLMAELELVRARGYAVNMGETEPDLVAVGVALRDRDDVARFALVATAPSSRGNAAWIRGAGIDVVRIADRFANQTK